jgi:hypothetical protein
MTARELIDWTLQQSGWGTLAALEQNRWIDCQPSFAAPHTLQVLPGQTKIPLQARLAEGALP